MLGLSTKILVMAVALTAFCSSTVVNDGKPIYCVRSAITSVRVDGCALQPCPVKKGRNLMVEIDFSFEKPLSTNHTAFQVFIPFWNKPGSSWDIYGSNVADNVTCEQLHIRECPAKAGEQYTLKSLLYVDPKLHSTIDHSTVGKVTTAWTLLVHDRAISDSESYSQCYFNVDLNIVE